jgi:hypothetical protein
MKKTVTLKISISLFLDIIAVLFIVFLGKISSFLGYPLYALDPMRMMIILAFAFTPRWNGWVLAILLPMVSYYFAYHPSLTKTSLMAIELLLNVWLFWFLMDKTQMTLLAIICSIICSKAVYYALKFLCLQLGWLSGELIATPLETQMITTAIFSLFIFFMFLIYGKPKKR